MGFFDRLSNGWQLGKQSLAVVWGDKTLALFPAISGIASMATIAAFYFGIGPETIQRWLEVQNHTGEFPLIGIALTFLLYLVLSAVTVYFNVALVGAASLSIDGRDTTLGDGITAANALLGPILAWSAISGTVGLLLSAIENNENAGRFVRSILGVVWTAITYFVLPIMVFERQGPFSSIGRSIKLMKGSWGENVGAQFSLGWFFFLFALPVVILFFLSGGPGGTMAAALVPLGIVYLLALAILNQAAKSVLTIVLYRFATEQEAVPGFDNQLLDRAFK
ncbi:MAG: hypothetical protein GY723_06785 [bacterium]|nr:hypothetical protein [bacterium]MCP5069622.1 hypothetical protein [bacterium]